MHELIGKSVVFYDPDGVSHHALVYEVHGEGREPLVSLVYVDRKVDEGKGLVREATSVPPTGETFSWERR